MIEQQENIFPEKEIIDLMQVGYNHFGSDSIPMDMIDSLVDYLIQVRVKEDKEFRELLGDGYYT